jgi:UDP-N-acetylmuramate: L-alanyl-gamma-D-glutamyl-meso-diaminopimelate ligase
LSEGCWTPRESFGLSQTAPACDWAAQIAPESAASRFAVLCNAKIVAEVAWELIGEHNVLNALAAIGAAQHAGVAPPRAAQALNLFRGVKRRMEVRGVVGGVTVYDDFAHHPTAIETTLKGLRARVGAQRILAVLEPRSNTMKRGILKDSLPESLRDADRTFVYTAGLGWEAGAVFKAMGEKARCDDDLERLVGAVAAEARSGDHVLVMSNGAFGGIHEKLLGRLK